MPCELFIQNKWTAAWLQRLCTARLIRSWTHPQCLLHWGFVIQPKRISDRFQTLYVCFPCWAEIKQEFQLFCFGWVENCQSDWMIGESGTFNGFRVRIHRLRKTSPPSIGVWQIQLALWQRYFHRFCISWESKELIDLIDWFDCFALRFSFTKSRIPVVTVRSFCSGRLTMQWFKWFPLGGHHCSCSSWSGTIIT